MNCYSCKHRFNDVEEGHLCRRVKGEIKLSDGTLFEWCSAPLAEAWSKCQGKFYEAGIWARIRYRIGL